MKPRRKPLRRKPSAPKKCFYCEDKKDPHYLDAEMLRKSLSDRGKIISRARSGVCAKHQRKLTVAIKRARHLALLPFLVRT